MRQRSLFGFIAAGLVLLLVAIAGFYWFVPKTSPKLAKVSGTTNEPGAAIFVSKQAPVMVSMLVNPDRLSTLSGNGELFNFQSSFLGNAGLNYQEDIQPWLGSEMTLAVTTLDIDRDSENGNQPGYLLALATENPQKSQDFLDLLFSKRVLAGSNLNVEEYEGIKLISDNTPIPNPKSPIPNPKSQIPNPQSKIENRKSKIQNPLAAAVVGDKFVLFANDSKVLREAINNVQAPDLNLNSYSKYQQAIKQISGKPLAIAFLNLANVAKWQGLKLSNETFDSQLVSLALPGKGVFAETSLLASGSTLPPSAQLSSPVGALQYVPKTAGVVISGANLNSLEQSNLAQFWTQVVGSLSTSSGLIQPLEGMQKRWGINLQSDIFSSIQGEYALGLLPSANGDNPDWIFVAEKSPTLPDLIDRLNVKANSVGLDVNTINLNSQKISAWTELSAVPTKGAGVVDGESITLKATAKGLHTTLGNYEIFASSLNAIDEVLKNQDRSMLDNRNFQDSISAFGNPNQGYVYIDWTKSQEILETQLPILKLAEVVGKPFFNNLRSLTLGSYGGDDGILKGGVFIKLDSM